VARPTTTTVAARRRTPSGAPQAAPRLAVVLFSTLIAAGVLLRLPAIAEPLGIDQGIFATTGTGLTHGAVLYRDLWDQKPPGIHLTYAGAIALAGPRTDLAFWLDLLAAVATCALVSLVASVEAGPTAALACAALYACLMAPAVAYDNGGFLERAVPECFIAVLVSAAALAATRASAGRGVAPALACGLCLGAAAVYKPTALVYWPALLIWLRLTGTSIRRFAIVSALAALVPAAAVAAWLSRTGGLADAWVAVVEYNRGYVTTGPGPIALADRLAHDVVRWIKTDPLWLMGAAGLAAAAATAAMARRVPRAPLLGACWLAAAAVAAAANGIRLYSTYWIPATPALALSAGWLLASAIAERSWVLRAVAAASIVLGAIGSVRAHQPERAWRRLAADTSALARSATTDPGYLELFGGYRTGRGYSARANQELSDYLRAHSEPADRVYIFGMAPAVYFMSGRQPANRFLWAYPAVAGPLRRADFTAGALSDDLVARAPRYLVLERNNRDSLTGWKIETEFTTPAMERLLAHYQLETEVEDFLVYRHR
jgi:hypothetical protein